MAKNFKKNHVPNSSQAVQMPNLHQSASCCVHHRRRVDCMSVMQCNRGIDLYAANILDIFQPQSRGSTYTRITLYTGIYGICALLVSWCCLVELADRA